MAVAALRQVQPKATILTVLAACTARLRLWDVRPMDRKVQQQDGQFIANEPFVVEFWGGSPRQRPAYHLGRRWRAGAIIGAGVVERGIDGRETVGGPYARAVDETDGWDRTLHLVQRRLGRPWWVAVDTCG